MSCYAEIKKLYLKEVADRGADASKGLPSGAWRTIIRNGVENFSGTDGDIAEIFLQADTDESRLLTYDEFVACMTKPHLDEKKLKDVEELFKTWDKSGDSKLSAEEIHQAVGKYREDTIARILKDADEDGDGFVSVAEFKAKLFGV